MVSPEEDLPWLTQKPGSVDCGAVAILNARLWLGEDVRRRDIAPLVAELGISPHKGGISGSDLDRWIRQKRHFGVKRLIQPAMGRVDSLLRSGSGLILRYVWRLDNRHGFHFVFVVQGSRNRIVVANPHRLSGKGRYETCRSFSTGDLKSALRRERAGCSRYPWIWPIHRRPG